MDVNLDKTKNGDARTVHLNPDVMAAIRSPFFAEDEAVASQIFPREDRSSVTSTVSMKDSIIAPGSRPPSLRQRFPESHGTDYATRFAPGSRWLAQPHAKSWEAAGHKTISQSARYSHLSPLAHSIGRGPDRHRHRTCTRTGTGDITPIE